MTHMSNKSNNGTNKTASNKGRRGPRPIMTVAMLREKMLKEMMVKELRKIETKYSRVLRRKQLLQDKLYRMEAELDNLKSMRTEYAAEVGG